MYAEVFALLDDALAPAGQARSRLYTEWVAEHRCTQAAELEAFWQQVEAEQRAGLHALVLADYEWGEALVDFPERSRVPGLTPDTAPALRVLMFAQLRQLSASEVADWLAAGQTQPEPAGLLGAQASVSRPQFDAAIGQIHEAIRSGQTYQVNYTYRWHAQLVGEPLALYRRLRAGQPVAYGALIALPVQANGMQPWVLSFSPELLVQVQRQGEVMCALAQPMKGTAARQPEPQADAAAASALAQDGKNRAENLMIVDLLRNDLGRIAQIGSVQVPALFEVQALPTVFQMTSSVRARLLPEVDAPALLRALFPCGSITGAPKRQTMAWIRALESSPRGLYCGAIGWLDAPAPGQRLGELCLAVAIRTLELALPAGGWQAGAAPVRWGVGGGIVLDSQAPAEWEETGWKARFVFRTDPGFTLFETLYLSPEGAVRAWPWHAQRLRRSAQALGWPLDEAAAWAQLQARAAQLHASAPGATAWRLRLSLGFDGALSLSHAPLAALNLDAQGGVSLGRAALRLPGAHALSAHKTTWRAAYDAAVRQAEQQGDFDLLFFNQAGELVEGGRSNVFVQLGGRWYTPPLSSGALPGVMRAQLLADPAWQATERVLYGQDVAQAQALMVCNALRGCVPARYAG